MQLVTTIEEERSLEEEISMVITESDNWLKSPTIKTKVELFMVMFVDTWKTSEDLFLKE